MNLQHFKQENKAVVGSYTPSESWSNYTQFAVMDEKTCGLLAAVGYFQRIHVAETWGVEHYKHAAECIEQAQLYANAPRLFEIVKNLLANPFNQATIQEARKVLHDITDISEPVTRLLGEDAMCVILHTEQV